MTTEPTPRSDEPLQFDRAEAAAGTPRDAFGRPVVTCRGCTRTIQTEYFAIGGAPLCDSCRRSFEAARDGARRWPIFVRAAAFGTVAAIAGAILYYAVIAITNFEIGIVAIVIGYIVGYAVRRGSGGFGARRFQVLALCLTYLSVGLAYTPLAFKQPANRGRTAASAPAASEGAPERAPSNASPSPRRALSPGEWLRAAGVVLLFVLALPVLVVINSLPSGLISAFIIGIGMRQAWRMTGAPRMDISGPYKIGSEPAASAT